MKNIWDKLVQMIDQVKCHTNNDVHQQVGMVKYQLFIQVRSKVVDQVRFQVGDQVKNEIK